MNFYEKSRKKYDFSEIPFFEVENFQKGCKYARKQCANVSYIHKEHTPQISAKLAFSTILSCNFSKKSENFFAPGTKIKVPKKRQPKKFHRDPQQLAVML